MSAERKYTDRDVRENDALVEAAVEFLENYHGEFEFLIDCKMRLSAGGDLSVGMIRGVLNCMRADPRVRNLPEPVLFLDEDAKVVDMKPYRRDRVKIVRPGPPVYEINRPWSIRTKAHINVPYVAAKSETSLLHKVEDSWDHYFEWITNQHDIGFRWWDLHVKPLCRQPQGLKNPILLTRTQMIWLQAGNEEGMLRRPYCGRCFD